MFAFSGYDWSFARPVRKPVDTEWPHLTVEGYPTTIAAATKWPHITANDYLVIMKAMTCETTYQLRIFIDSFVNKESGAVQKQRISRFIHLLKYRHDANYPLSAHHAWFDTFLRLLIDLQEKKCKWEMLVADFSDIFV